MSVFFSEDDLLPLSGIQHFAFCERQWALIHIEKQWVENLRTTEGTLLHQRVDDPYFTESRGDVKIIRSVPLRSQTLGLFGVADVIELHKSSSNELTYNIVEYKRGKPKPDDRDEVQLCAQAVCLEEMLNIKLEYGHMYYGEIKRRHIVAFNESLRKRVNTLAAKMHLLFEKGETPPAVRDKRCKNCSMINICLPKLNKRNRKAQTYMEIVFEDMKKD